MSENLDNKWREFRKLSEVKTKLLQQVARCMAERENLDKGFIVKEDPLIDYTKEAILTLTYMETITNELVEIAEAEGSNTPEFEDLIQHNRMVDATDLGALNDILHAKRVFKRNETDHPLL